MRFSLARLALGSAALSLAGLGPVAHAGGLPVCNAKHKRPANLYGSVLSDGLKPAVAAAGEVSPAKPDPTASRGPVVAAPAKPNQVSRADVKASLAPCAGDRA